MKNLYSVGLLAALLFTAFTLHAQVEPPLNQQVPDNPSLFSSLPDKFECSVAQLEKFFSLSPPQRVSLKLNPIFNVDGVISEKFERSNHLTSINIRLTNYSDALFNISRIVDSEGVRYTGRIASVGHGDLLILKKENERYYFTKREMRFSVVE